jgi:hypothetical protein
MGVRKRKKGKPYKASDNTTYQVTKMVSVDVNRVGEMTGSVNFGGESIEVTGYNNNRGKSAKEARQEHRATKRASRKRKREHRRSRKNK